MKSTKKEKTEPPLARNKLAHPQHAQPHQFGGVQHAVIQQQVRTIFDPDVLQQYRSMVPDAPERVLRVFEQNSATEREIRELAAKAEVSDNRRRDWMAFGIIFGGMSISAIFAALNRPYLSGATLVGIAGYSVAGFLIKRSKTMSPPSPPA